MPTRLMFSLLLSSAIAIGTQALAAPPPAADPPAANQPAVSQPAVRENGTGLRTLILVRHGAYDEADERDPDVGRALTDEGREQANLVAERLATFPVRVDAVHASTMTRARQTAEIIGATLGLAPRPSRLIRECTPPTEREDIMAREKPSDLAVCRDTLELAWSRFFVPSPERDSVEVLVCHGNVIRYLTGRALGLDPLRWLRMSLGNCSITTIRVRPDGRMQVLEVGDVGHLPPRLQSRLWTPAPRPAPAARPEFRR
jgi:serine/threonine-protein phosphatase PGAM5